MRINFWLGVRSTLPVLRNYLEDENRICTPFLPAFQAARSERLVDTIKQTKRFSSVNEFIWYELDKPQANLALHNLNTERNPIRLFYRFSPPGSRFYFYKIDEATEIEKFKYFVRHLSDDRWLLRVFDIRKEQLESLTDDDIIKRYNISQERINFLADEIGASDWTDFNLKDYFQDDIDAPTTIKVRMKVKIPDGA